MVSKCILPVAGLGTRFLPVTKSVPKELLPILNKPLIQYAIEEAFNANINSFSLVISKKKESIKHFFEEDLELKNHLEKNSKDILLLEINKIINKCSFSYPYQDQMLGLGHAIYCGMGLIDNEAFAVILPDDFCFNAEESVIKQMSDLHEKYPDKSIIAVEEVDSGEISNYGVISGSSLPDNENVFLVDDLIEKPMPEEAPSNLAIIGRYIFTPEIFPAIEKTQPDKNGEIQVTNALRKLARKQKVLAYKFKGRRIDCGKVDGYVEANKFMLGNKL